MTFDALRPDANASSYNTVELTRDGVYRVVSMPATFDFQLGREDMVQEVKGWEAAISASSDLGAIRKKELLTTLREMQAEPSRGLKTSVARRR
jgi:hypothetical protein